jgi:hypothetical protein
MPRPRGRRHETAKGVDAVAPAAPPVPPAAVEKDLDERERRQSSRRKAPGPRGRHKRATKEGPVSDVPPTDPA